MKYFVTCDDFCLKLTFIHLAQGEHSLESSQKSHVDFKENDLKTLLLKNEHLTLRAEQVDDILLSHATSENCTWSIARTQEIGLPFEEFLKDSNHTAVTCEIGDIPLLIEKGIPGMILKFLQKDLPKSNKLFLQ